MLLSSRIINSGLVLICGLLLSAGSSWAQLSSDDIATLHKQGQAEGWTFSVGENGATDYPLHVLCGAVEPPDWQTGADFDPCTPSRGLPGAFDWRDYNGYPTVPVKHQGGCGSCWAFAAIGVVENAIRIKDGIITDLSEQWLISCTSSGSCSGGWPSAAFRYISRNGRQDFCGNGGAVLEHGTGGFPYEAWNAPCNCPYWHMHFIESWSYVGNYWESPPVEQIKQAIHDHGPVATQVYVNSAFHAYSPTGQHDRVFNACDDQWVNHSVVLVGWDDNLGSDGVWILRNSWGTGWGIDGYMLIEYGCSNVGYRTSYVNYLGEDCNDNDIPDPCDLDCGEPGYPCDVPGCGQSEDCNFNGFPDECESQADCNNNGVQDICDIYMGTSADCQPNSIPDECELADGDCNLNMVPDDCDVLGGASEDCQPNGIPDECELGVNDCNNNNVPDECDRDCNTNGVPDECDVTSGASPDCNNNMRPDECDVERHYNLWDGFNSIPKGTGMDGFDAIPSEGGDGSYWLNPQDTAKIWWQGCEGGSLTDRAVQISVPGESGTADQWYLTSEHFRTDGGALPLEEQVYRMTFRVKPGLNDNPGIDWEFSIRDDENNSHRRVILVRFCSTASSLLPGSIVVEFPRNQYIDTGVAVVVDPPTCYDFEVVLTNHYDGSDSTVELYIDGLRRVTQEQTLDDGARRMDYFQVDTVLNGSGSSAIATLKLDHFDLWLTGGSSVAPEQIPDCNDNSVFDECDVVVGGDFDADGDIALPDYQGLVDCISGPGCSPGPAVPECAGMCLGAFDFDGDADIDLADLANFQRAFTGVR
ncbi:MAG: hypothetical protein KAV82_12730 [Phycisphaerae bacterium]|nr:hypothetical protein [Phycisphaerae bacterium]